jgi:hypothetical protein
MQSDMWRDRPSRVRMSLAFLLVFMCTPSRPSRAIGTLCLLLLVDSLSAATSVATVGDSLADGIYLAMLSRPDLLKKYDLHVARWSHPVIGLSRSDYFDYPDFLQHSSKVGVADFCVVQIGTNDMQGIPAGAKNRWIAYGSDSWKAAYISRVKDVARILSNGHCREVLWILQPGFEKRSFLAQNRGLINQLQVEALSSAQVKVFNLSTTGGAYGADGTHFNRDFVLALGGAVVRTIVLSRDARQSSCAACHGNVAVRNVLSRQDLLPLNLLPTTPVALPAGSAPR